MEQRTFKKYAFAIIDEKGNRSIYTGTSTRQLKSIRSSVTKTYPHRILDVSRIIKPGEKVPMFMNFLLKRRK